MEPRIEHVEHRCDPPMWVPLPDGASKVVARWRCTECRQKWRITRQSHDAQAVRYGRSRSWRQ